MSKPQPPPPRKKSKPQPPPDALKLPPVFGSGRSDARPRQPGAGGPRINREAPRQVVIRGYESMARRTEPQPHLSQRTYLWAAKFEVGGASSCEHLARMQRATRLYAQLANPFASGVALQGVGPSLLHTARTLPGRLPARRNLNRHFAFSGPQPP